ncbi:MAG: hypothetical protein ACAH80_01510 [Alphaproteobacteria bacterium]
MKKYLILLALAALFIPQQARAYVSAAPAAGSEYKEIENIPAPLATFLVQGGVRYEEHYITQVLQPLRQYAKSKKAIEASDHEREETRSRFQNRRYSADAVMRYDRDFDGRVTRDEILEGKNAERGSEMWHDDSGNEMEKLQADNLLNTYDEDKDGIVTLKEAGEAGMAKREKQQRRKSSRRKGQLAQLYALDPDKDGRLTSQELVALAKKAFAAADDDGDGMLSLAEQKKIQIALTPVINYGEGCPAPAPVKDDKVVFVSVEQGGSLTGLGPAWSQRMDTRLVRLNIAKGTGMLYLVANSRQPVIWQLTGDVSRVSRLLMHGQMDNTKMEGGVAGLAADKVSYLKYDSEDGNYTPCIPETNVFQRSVVLGAAGRKRRGPPQPHYNDALRNILGRTADITGIYSAPYRLDIGDKVEAVTVTEEQPTPEGFDAATWKDFITLTPGGVIALKKEDVVSEQSLEERKLLPGLAGVAQLVNSGHLAREKDPRGASIVLVYGGLRTPAVIRLRDYPTLVEDGGTGRKVKVVEDSLYRIKKEIKKYPAFIEGYIVRYLVDDEHEAPAQREGCFVREDDLDNCQY